MVRAELSLSVRLSVSQFWFLANKKLFDFLNGWLEIFLVCLVEWRMDDRMDGWMHGWLTVSMVHGWAKYLCVFWSKELR